MPNKILAAHPGAAIPHPVRGVLAARRIQMRQLANAAGYDERHVSGVVFKHYHATPEFRAAVAGVLALPESELFDAEYCTSTSRPHREAAR